MPSALGYRLVNAPGTHYLDRADQLVDIAHPGGGNLSLYLPNNIEPSVVPLIIRHTSGSSNAFVLVHGSTRKISGASSLTLVPGQTIALQQLPDGNWNISGGNQPGLLFQGQVASGQVFSSSVTKLNMTALIDSAGMFNASNQSIVIPATGYYHINLAAQLAASPTDRATYTLGLYIGPVSGPPSAEIGATARGFNKANEVFLLESHLILGLAKDVVLTLYGTQDSGTDVAVQTFASFPRPLVSISSL